MPTKTHEQKTLATSERETASYEAVRAELLDIHSRPDFIQFCHTHDITPHDRSTAEYANAYGAFVHDYAQHMVGQGLMDADHAALLELGGEFAGAMYAKKELVQFQRSRKPSREQRSYKRDVIMPQIIGYNRRVVDYLRDHDDVAIGQLSQMIYEQTHPMIEGEDASLLHDQLEEIMRGCNTEAKTAKLFMRVGIPFELGTVAEDARGGDLIIPVGNRRILVDLKSSLDGMTGVDREKAADAIERGKMYIVTGRDRIKLFMKFDNPRTSSLPDDTSKDIIVAAQVQRAVTEAMAVDRNRK